MGRGIDIPWLGVDITMGRVIRIPWVGGRYIMSSVSIYHG
jgi:hypothetical protein